MGTASEPAPAPRTITTQDRSGAVILWDATPYVERFTQDGTAAHDALQALETTALTLFVRNAPGLSSSAHHLRVSVSFVRTGATEARYQTKTVEGVQDILTVEGNLHRGMRFRSDWEAQFRQGVLPPGVSLHLARDLPAEAL